MQEKDFGGWNKKKKDLDLTSPRHRVNKILVTVLVEQLRLFDIRRLNRKIDVLSISDFEKTKNLMRRLIQ
jgi:hypothetical protein